MKLDQQYGEIIRSTERLYIFLIGFYSPYRTLAFPNGLLDPQTFGRAPWLGDQSNAKDYIRKLIY